MKMEIKENKIYVKYTYLARHSGFPDSIVNVFSRILCHNYHKMVLYDKHKNDLKELDSLTSVTLNKFYQIKQLDTKYEKDYLQHLTEKELELYKVFKSRFYLNSPTTYPGVKIALNKIENDLVLKTKFNILFKMFLYEIESRYEIDLLTLVELSNKPIHLVDSSDEDLFRAFALDVNICKFREEDIIYCLHLLYDNKVLSFNKDLLKINSKHYRMFDRAKFYIKAYLISEDFGIDEKISLRYLGDFKDDANFKELYEFFGQCSTSEKWSLLHAHEEIINLTNLLSNLV